MNASAKTKLKKCKPADGIYDAKEAGMPSHELFPFKW